MHGSMDSVNWILPNESSSFVVLFDLIDCLSRKSLLGLAAVIQQVNERYYLKINLTNRTCILPGCLSFCGRLIKNPITSPVEYPSPLQIKKNIYPSLTKIRHIYNACSD